MPLTVRLLGTSNLYWRKRFKEEVINLSQVRCEPEWTLILGTIHDSILPSLTFDDRFNLAYWLWQTGYERFFDLPAI
jgi:hypothetical protein